MSIILYLRFELITMKTMINYKTIFNFISQMKIKEWNLQKIVNVSSKLKTLNDTLLKCYDEHILRIEMIDVTNHEICTKQTIIVVNMTRIDMILNLSWLRKLNSDIDWFSSMIRWRINNANTRKKVYAVIFENDSKCFESTSFIKNDAKNNAMNRHKIDIAISINWSLKSTANEKKFKSSY